MARWTLTARVGPLRVDHQLRRRRRGRRTLAGVLLTLTLTALALYGAATACVAALD